MQQVNLGGGQPREDLLPLQLIQHATHASMSSNDIQTKPSRMLQYGDDDGDADVRSSLADFLNTHIAHYRLQRGPAPVTASELWMTAGASQGLEMLCTLLANHGDTIVVEEPTYFLALSIFSNHSFNIVGIPVDSDGLRTDILEQKLVAGLRPALLYTIPTHHNPTSVTLSHERRKVLCELSIKYSFYVVADEVYHMLSLDNDSEPTPLVCYDTSKQRVFSLGSFSKLLAPGLRCGWIQVPSQSDLLVKKINRRYGLINSGGGLSPFSSFICKHAIDCGSLAEYISKLRTEYKSLRDTLCNALTNEFALSEPNSTQHPLVQFSVPKGGFFLWLQLSERVLQSFRRATDVDESSAATAFAEYLLSHYALSVRMGSEFSTADGSRTAAEAAAVPSHRCLRLCFAGLTAEQLTDAVLRLKQALTQITSVDFVSSDGECN